MSTNDSTDGGLSQFCAGHPLEYATEGFRNIPSSKRRSHDTVSTPIEEKYGVSVSDETANVINRLYTSVDARQLSKAIKTAGLDSVEDYSSLFTEQMLDDLEADEADLGLVMQTLDIKLSGGRAPRDKEPSKVTSRKHRNAVYVPELIEDASGGGTVYMAKTLSTHLKVMMAHDLDERNQVVVVDDYEKWERLLGWEKLKDLPHGKNKIREELGDQLSDEVLKAVAGEGQKSDTSSSFGSTGKRSPTPPTEEMLNIAGGSRHRKRFTMKAEDIFECFDDDGYISAYKRVETLVLFPSTTNLYMTNHWWVCGPKWDGAGVCAIANCNKSTFEYLNKLDNVWHIEDYIEQAADYEFETNHGTFTMDTVEHDSLVFHTLDDDTHRHITEEPVFSHIAEKLPAYCDEELFSSPPFPHAEDMLYAPITYEDVFWLRPQLREQSRPDEGDSIVLYGDSTPRNLGRTFRLSSDYKLYARARLHDWDFDSTEMAKLDELSRHMYIGEGGYEVVQTLAMLHDEGKRPFSKRPQSRWSQ